jgi:hypothetical protein
MTVRDIGHHLHRMLGTELSHDTISWITDSVAEEVKAWQSRPLEEIYPIIYLDAIVVKVRDGHQVRNKAAHIAVGVDLDGRKHVLGIWVQASEGAKFWAGVCAELRNRGVKDVLIVRCDGLSGFPEAIEATWPASMVQTCTVHLIRAAMRFVSYQDRKKVAAALKPIYTAPTADAAETELLAFADSELGRKYPAAVATWEHAWERFIPFLQFPPTSARSSTPRTRSRASTTSSARSPRIVGTSPTTTPWSSCSGSRSATSRTNAPASARRNAERPETPAKPPPNSSKAPPSTAGNKPCKHSPWPTPNDSPPTYPENERSTYTDHLTGSREPLRQPPSTAPTG